MALAYFDQMEPMNSADHLVEIFKYFGPAVHSQLLIVNRRINRIITRPTWEYRSLLSIGQYPQLADQPSFPLLQSVCSNRRKMLKVLDLSKPIAISGQEMCELIRLLDELEHLNIRAIPLSNDALKYIGRNLRDLRSIGFCLQVSNDFDGLDELLGFCKKLKVFKIYEGELRNWSDQIARLPKSLKCVDIRPAIRSKKFLELLAELKIKLEYLVINDRDLNMNLFVKVDFTELKYLGLPMVVGYEKYLWCLKHDMKALQGLEMSFYEMGPEDFEKLFAGLLRNFQQLRHIGLSQVSVFSSDHLFISGKTLFK